MEVWPISHTFGVLIRRGWDSGKRAVDLGTSSNNAKLCYYKSNYSFIHYFLRQGLYIVLSGLAFSVKCRVALNSCQPFCVSVLSAGNKSVCHHALGSCQTTESCVLQSKV